MSQFLTPESALKAAVHHLGSQAEMARLVGVSQPAVWNWVHNDKPLPAEYVLAVEAATGISRHDLRPDIYPRENFPSPGARPADPAADAPFTSAAGAAAAPDPRGGRP